MPSRNEIVPLSVATDFSEAETRPGPNAVSVPVPRKGIATPFGGKAKATSTEMVSIQEQRMKLVRSQQQHTTFQLFFGVFGVLLMMMQMEYLWLANTRTLPDTCPVDAKTNCPLCFEALSSISMPVSEGRMILLALRVLISFSTALMLYYIYLYYAAECEVMKLKNIMPPKATLMSSSLRRTLLIEMAILGVHPFPGIESVDPKWPRLVVATSLVMFTRVVLMVRVVQFRNSFNSRNGWFIGALTNVDFTPTFFMKSALKNHPTSCLMASFATLGFVAGYSLYVTERFFCAFKAGSCCEPMLLGDALWMLIITILTIGYGDVVPRTTLGRAIAISAGVFGTLSTAVTIAVMSNYLVLTRSEHKVNAFLKKSEKRQLINDQAARALQAFVQLRTAQRRHSQHSSAKANEGENVGEASAEVSSNKTGTSSTKRALRRAELKLFTVLGKYRQVKRRVQSNDISDPMDSQMTMLEMMEVNVEYIRTKIEELSELFLTQTSDRTRKKHHPSNILAASAMSESLLEITPRKGGVSVSSGDSIALLQQLQQQQPNQLQWSSPRSQQQQQQSYQLQQTGPTMSSLQDSDRVASNTSLVNGAASNNPNPSSAQTAPPSPEHVPTWALVLEMTLQNLLEQVSRVSDEVESMKSRMQTQSESIESRLSNLEKHHVVSDALHEISMVRGAARKLFRRGSTLNEDGSGAGRFASLPVVAPRRRGSAVTMQRPSIHNFVTQSELREYQTTDEEHGEG